MLEHSPPKCHVIYRERANTKGDDEEDSEEREGVDWWEKKRDAFFRKEKTMIESEGFGEFVRKIGGWDSRGKKKHICFIAWITFDMFACNPHDNWFIAWITIGLLHAFLLTFGLLHE